MVRVFSIASICIWLTAGAQLNPLTSHFMLTNTIKYPGLWGANSLINVLANTRYQYAGIEGAPLQASVSITSPIPYAKGQGVGGNIIYDQLGTYRFIMINAGYNYTYINEKFSIGAGVSLGVKYTRFDGSKVITPTGNYTTNFEHNDPLIPQNIVSSVVPSFTAGVGFSNKMLVQQFVFSDVLANNITIVEDKSSIKYGKTLTSLTKFNIGIGSNFELEPSMQLVTDFKHFQHILGVMALYKDRIGIGIYTKGYTKNTFESLIPTVRAKAFKNMTFQYSYDALMNELNNTSSGSHELSIIYAMPKTWQKYYGKTINNPRYL